jgi:(2Fe-2S) ferredoxin
MKLTVASTNRCTCESFHSHDEKITATVTENDTNSTAKKLAICVNRRYSDKPSCGGRGSVAIADALEAGIAERGLDIQVERIICFGMCTQGPSMRLVPNGDFFRQMKLADVPEMLDQLAETD